MISCAKLKEQLHYDPETGVFTRLTLASKARKIRVGDVAGCRIGNGYWQIGLCSKYWPAHKLAWFYVHGNWPKMLDHVNRDKTDNRIANLRLATPTENQWNRGLSKNNTSGVVGVSFIRKTQKWQATITIAGKNRNLGTFSEKTAAIAARKDAEEIYFGKFKGGT